MREDFIERNGAKTKYYVPELNKWINNKSLSRELSKIGMTSKDYYDKYLDKDEFYDENGLHKFHKCKCKSCNKEAHWIEISTGYRDYCSKDCMFSDEEFLLERSKIMKVAHNTELAKKNHSKASLNLWRSESHISKMKELYKDELYRHKLSKSIKDSLNSEEVRSKMSVSQINKWKDENKRRSIIESFRRYQGSKEGREKNSKAQIKRFSNPLERKKVSESVKRSWMDESIRNSRISGMKLSNSKESTRIKRSLAASEINSRDYMREIHSKIITEVNNRLKVGISNMSTSLFSDVCSKLPDNIREESKYGVGNEVIVKTGPEVGDIKLRRSLDFCVPSLMKIVEFNGKYWHPRDIEKYGIDKVNESIVNDTHKINSLEKLGYKILVVSENDLSDNYESLVMRIVNFILN